MKWHTITNEYGDWAVCHCVDDNHSSGYTYGYADIERLLNDYNSVLHRRFWTPQTSDNVTHDNAELWDFNY